MNKQELLARNTYLEATLASMNTKITAMSTGMSKLTSKNMDLQAQLDWFTRQLFGKKSEKLISPEDKKQLTFDGFDLEEQPEEDEEKPANKKRKKARRDGQDKVKLPDNIPIEKQIIDIPESEKICAETGKPFEKIGEEITSKLAYKPGSHYVKQTIRPKYATPEGSIKTAELPETILNRCLADESLLAQIITQKYIDHLPLYRISEILERDGIQISRQTLNQWVIRAGLALEPLYNEMHKHIIQNPELYADETPIALLKPGNKKVHSAYMWVLVGGGEKAPYRTYHFKENRQHQNINDLIGHYKGYIHSDAYQAYKKLSDQVTWCPCFAHIRRKFFEAQSGHAKLRKTILTKIRYLYMYEKVAWKRSPQERLTIRQQKEIPIIDELTKIIQEQLKSGKILPKSKIGKALGYYCNLIPYLKNYTTNANARIDNNTAERAIRPLALGRKNWLFAGSERGGHVCGILLSLVQTCRGLGINSQEYLEDVMVRLMSHNSQKLAELLPDRWAEARKATATP